MLALLLLLHSLSVVTGFAESSPGQPQHTTKTTTCVDDNPILQLVRQAKRLGPVANDRTEQIKNEFLKQARALQSLSIPELARTDWTGRHERLY